MSDPIPSKEEPVKPLSEEAPIVQEIVKHVRKSKRIEVTLLRLMLRELRKIRRLNDGGLHAAEALGRPRPIHPRHRRRLVSARDAAEALSIELIDLVELGEEARQILDEEKRARVDVPREREGRTFRVRRSHLDR